MNLPDRLLSQKEVAEILAIDENTVKRYEKEGILRRVKRIKAIRYNPDAIAELIGEDLSSYTPLMVKREQKKIMELEQENAMLKGKLEQIYQLTKGAS